VETTCQPANAPDNTRLSAKVRDISRAGINLVVNQPIEIGKHLSVELPSLTDKCSSTVLAYVVRVSPLASGEWSLGCTFAAELTDEDLEPFGARRLKPQADDQRTWVRFPCNAKASFQPTKANSAEPWAASVINISASGVGLRVDRPIDLGALLSLDLRSANGNFELKMLACVVRVNAQGDNEWTLGCNLIRELSYQELKALL
jgi:hypothetical protein